jgi:hypothetical protein
MVKRIILVLFVLMLGISAIGAQDNMAATVFCGDLAEADCDLLVKSQEVMAGVTSFSTDFSLFFEMSGLDMGMGSDSLAMGLTGEGQLVADFGDVDMMAADAEMDVLIDALLNGFEMDMHLEIVLPDDLSMGMPELALDIVMVDGVIYMDTAPFMGGMEPMWMGIDLAGLMDTYMADIMAQLDMDMMLDTTDMMDMGSVEAFGYADDYTTIVRAEDRDLNGQTVAVFKTSYDFVSLFTDETFRGLYAEIFDSVMAAQMDLGDLDMDVEELLDAVAVMFEDTNFSMVQWIGVDDYYSYHNALYIDMTLNMNAVAEAIGEVPPSVMPEEITMILEGELNLDDFNEDFGIVAPEGAQIIDPMMFLGADF